MKRPVKSNEEILRDCLEKKGHIRLKISFSVGNATLVGEDITLIIRDLGIAKGIPELVRQAIANC